MVKPKKKKTKLSNKSKTTLIKTQFFFFIADGVSKNDRFWIFFFNFVIINVFFSFVEEDKIMFREYRKLLETMPQIANMFDPMMSQTLIGCSSFYL